MGNRVETVESEEFLRSFGEVYEALYRNEGYVDYRRAVDLFDDLLREDEGFKAELLDFAEFRQDPVTSDRECAAFVMALRSNGMR